MKTMTCKQLGGACDHEFKATTFEQMAAQSRQHGMEMIQKNDEPHQKAMAAMQDLMGSPEAMNAWMEEKRKLFESLPADS